MAAAALREAEAASEEAERNFVRIRGLYGIQAVSDSDYDSAKRSVDMAREKVESARQQLALAKEGPRIEDRKTAVANLKQAEAVLAIAKDHLKKSRLHAPSDGIIAFREVEEGEVLVIPPGITITQIVDLERLKIKISVGEKDIHLVEKDKRFFFTVDAIPEEVFQCRFFFRSPAANPVTRAFPVELIVEEPDERMVDGLTARVKFPIINEKKIIKVPSAWLSEENGKIGLYVVKEGKAQFINISLGAYYDQRVEILSGLTEQELVIINPAGIRTGDTVRY
jgi:RND family efflux transporter MFP subunit